MWGTKETAGCKGLFCRAWVSYKYGGRRVRYKEGCSERFFFYKAVFTSIDCSSDFHVIGRETEVRVNLGVICR